jgi:hypothetical protein
VVTAAVALTGCVLSALLLYQGGSVAGWFLAGHVSSPLTWTLVKAMILAVVMLPGALGLAILLLSLSIARGRRGQQALQRELREVLLATAGAGVAVGAAVQLGVNLLGLTVIAAVAAIVCGAVLWVRPVRPARTEHRSGPLEIPTAAQRLAVLGTFALGTLGLAVQMRVLGDALGATLTGVLLWLAGSLAGLGWLLARRDARSRPPSRTRVAACVIGLAAGLLLQLSLVGAGLGASSGGWVLWGLAAGGQVPLLAMAATVLCRVRRVFHASGGRPREFISRAGVGVSVAAVVYLVVAVSPAGSLIALGVALAVLVGAVLFCIRHADQPGSQVAWAVLGTGLTCLVTLAVLLGVRSVHRRLGRVHAGGWLTVSESRSAVLPVFQPPRSREVDAVLADLLSGARGTWMNASPVDLAPALVDPNAPVTWRNWPGDPVAAGRWGTSLPARLASTREHFDGAMYEPLPARHPAAWRAYCLETMKALKRTVSRGKVVVRSRARAANAAAALAVAVTYRHAIGDGWVVADLRGGSVDMLIVGPLASTARPTKTDELIVVKLSKLLESLGPLRPIRVFRPGGWASLQLDVNRLRRLLRREAEDKQRPLPF